MARIGAVISICQGRAPRAASSSADCGLHVRPVGSGRLPQDPPQVVGGQQVLDRDLALLRERRDQHPRGGQAGRGDRVALGPHARSRRAVGADGQREAARCRGACARVPARRATGRRTSGRPGRGSQGCRAGQPCSSASRWRRRSAPSRGPAGRGWCRAAGRSRRAPSRARVRRPGSAGPWPCGCQRYAATGPGAEVARGRSGAGTPAWPTRPCRTPRAVPRSPRAARAAPRRRVRRTRATAWAAAAWTSRRPSAPCASTGP